MTSLFKRAPSVALFLSAILPVHAIGNAGPGAPGGAASAVGAAEAKSKGAGLESLARLEARGARVSALVVRLRDGEVLAERHATRRLSPASVSKLALAGAALETFGSEHVFVSRFHTLGTRKGGTLQGDLVFEGAGDPYLTNEKLWFLATDVARAGVRTVTGDLVVNTSLFGTIEADSNRAAGARASSHAYDSPLSAAAVNFSVLAVVASPGDASGAAGRVALEPYPLDTVAMSGGVTTGKGSAGRVAVTRARSGTGDRLTISGSVPMAGWPVRVYRSVSDADAYAGSVLKAFLRASGVEIKGKVRVERSALSSKARPLAAVEGFPLDWQVRGLFKVSNNFIGDMLTLQLDVDDSSPGRERRGATLAGGARKLTEYMNRVVADADAAGLVGRMGSVRPKGQRPVRLASGQGTMEGAGIEQDGDRTPLILRSGSGLTPENRLSARDVVALLARMHANAREFPSFLTALPIPGAEGTARKRFSAPEERHLQDRLRGKTGTLTEPIDAVGLGGYSRLKDGDWVAFAILVNGSPTKPNFGVETIRDAIDADLARILPAEK